MGIPGLIGHLRPYFTFTIIGCNSPACYLHPGTNVEQNKVVIDGPGLVHHVYCRMLLSKLPALYNAFDAIPTYEEIGVGVLTFLEQLRAHNVYVTKIYFDGYLPEEKRPQRIERLGKSHQLLKIFRACHNNGFNVQDKGFNQHQSPLSQIFNYQTIGARHRCLPSAPFIVPAALDALRSSDFASVTELVPGEADAYCARKAREVGAIILTSDSDLLVYDIGPKGRVTLFEHVHLSSNKKPCTTLEARTLQHSKVAERMRIPSLQRLAFEVKQHFNVGLCEVTRCAREPKDTVALQKFSQNYDLDLNNNPAHDMFGHLLDSRLSELALQLQAFATETSSVQSMPISSVQSASSKTADFSSTVLLSRWATIYLPFLIDDPSRFSAWACSSSTRQIAYSLLFYSMSSSPNLNGIIEYTRKGLRMVGEEVPIPLTALPDTGSQSFIFQARHLLSRTQQDLAAVSVSQVREQLAWYYVALKEVYAWYIRSNKNPPCREILLRAITGSVSEVLSWEDIHLGAQVQAVLYALRMLKQSMLCVRFCRGCAGPERDDFKQVVRSLESLLRNLPDLKDMPLSRMAVQRLVVDMKIDAGKMHDIVIGRLGKEEIAELEKESKGLKGKVCGANDVAKIAALALATYGRPTNSKASKRTKKHQGDQGKRRKIDEQKAGIGMASNRFSHLDVY